MSESEPGRSSLPHITVDFYDGGDDGKKEADRRKEDYKEEMERMFRPARRFSLDEMTASARDETPQHHYDEEDYRSHRQEAFPHQHHPLRSVNSHSLKHLKGLAGRDKDLKGHKPKIKPETVKFSPSLPEVQEQKQEGREGSPNGGLSGNGSESVPANLSPPPEDIARVPSTESKDTPVQFRIGSGASNLDKLGGSSQSVRVEEAPPSPQARGSGVDLGPVKFLVGEDEEQRLQASKNNSAVGFFVGEDEGAKGDRAGAGSPPRTIAHPAFRKDSSPVTTGDAATQHYKHNLAQEPQGKKEADGPEGEDVPRTSEMAAGHVPGSGIERKGSKVSFKDEATPAQKGSGKPHKRSSSSKKKKHRPAKGHHLSFTPDDLHLRRQKGSEVMLEAMDHVPSKQDAEDEDEADNLPMVHLDDMASHRFEDVRGIRRHKIQKRPHAAMSSIIQIGQSDKPSGKKSALKRGKSKKDIDHSPHEVFVELDELFLGENQDWEWREKARWIKFEEDVEEGAERWGKPHVASLSFHSLLELRRCIEKGSILLDLEATDLSSIAHQVVEAMIVSDQIQEDKRGDILRALLLKHRHVAEKKAFIRRNFSYNNLMGLDRRWTNPELFPLIAKANKKSSGGEKMIQAIPKSREGSFDKNPSSGSISSWFASHFGSESRRRSSNPDPTAATIDSKKDIVDGDIALNNKPKHVSIDLPDSGIDNVIFAEPQENAELTKRDYDKRDMDIMRRIPVGAEATTVLVGTVGFLDKPVMAFVRLAEGQFLGNLTEVPLPVRFLFILLGPAEGSMDYHEIGRSISTLMSNTTFHDVAYRADEREDLLGAINEFLDDSMVLPPGEWDKKTLMPIMDMARQKQLRKRKKKKEEEEKPLVPKAPPRDPLRRTKRCFGGMIDDVWIRFPQYLSDIKDGLNFQCLASFIFIYFAALSPAITFGGLLSEVSKKFIGAAEVILGTALAGCMFALVSAQPLTIVGHTGPVLVFEEAVFKFCESLDIEFMSFRAWIGIWLTIITTIIVAFEGVFLVRYITRFVEEVFASLISLIFIFEVFKKLATIFQKHPLLPQYAVIPSTTPVPMGNMSMLNMTTLAAAGLNIPGLNMSGLGNGTTPAGVEIEPLPPLQPQPNTALLSLILTAGTFFIAYFLKIFRNSKFLGRNIRRALGDFGIPIAIAVMVFLDYLIQDTYTEKLEVPDGLSPTAPEKRGWFINPMGMTKPIPVWQIFAAAIPALLVFILIFMESEITWIIVTKKGLRKGTGYHWDLFLIGLLGTVCGLFGFPFLSAATVRTVAHVSSLSVFSRTDAPGVKPKLLQVTEQRVTSLCVHIMIGLSLLLGAVLRQIPIAVLFGVFLYMGVASMSGIQFFERMELVFMPVKHHPDVGFVRKVRTWKMNVYTLIQFLCLGALWAVKSTAAALAFPFVLIMMVPLRLKGLKFFFSEQELHELDKEDVDEDEEEEDEPDFYTQAHMPL